VDAETRQGWSRRDLSVLSIGLLGAGLLRLALLPTVGLRDDTDQFAGWVHRLATDLPLGDFQSPALLLAVLPTLGGGWASIVRWGHRVR
jgi:hypothetical protein